MPRIWLKFRGIVKGPSRFLSAARPIAALLMVGVVLAAGGPGTLLLADPLYPTLSLLMQSDAAYDVGSAGKMATANPDDLLFRVMGPQTPSSMRKADIVNFVGSLNTWSGRLWFNVDATKNAFDSGYWGNTYSSNNKNSRFLVKGLIVPATSICAAEQAVPHSANLHFGPRPITPLPTPPANAQDANANH